MMFITINTSKLCNKLRARHELSTDDIRLTTLKLLNFSKYKKKYENYLKYN